MGEVMPADPGEVLLDAVSWTAAMVRWLRRQLAEIGIDEIGFGVTKVVDKTSTLTPGIDETRQAKQHVMLQMLREWTDQLGRLCALAIKAGVELRRVELAERVGALLADVLERTLADLDLPADTFAAARLSLGRQLRQVSSELAG
jgi:hypothetical protein